MRSIGMYKRKPAAQRAMIVTAWAEEQDMRIFHEMRRRFFPGHRNYLSAHITLFHHLKPGLREPAVQLARDTDWSRIFALDDRGRFGVEVQGVMGLGKGTAYRLEAEPLIKLRTPFKNAFTGKLTPQDERPWKRPHVTVQNKVDKDVAKRLERHLAARFKPCTLHIKGLCFYRYDYGPWALLEQVRF